MELSDALLEFRAMHARASTRQKAIQRYCCAEMAKRGVSGVEVEVSMPAYYRMKKWDVGLIIDDEPCLGISCKSIVSNHGGTVPNRIDDMLGEAVSLHRAYPRAVIGYLFMMSRIDESKATRDETGRKGGMTRGRVQELQKRGDLWFERLVESVTVASDRDGPDDYPEKWEAVSCAQVDFTTDPFQARRHPKALEPPAFFDRLAEIFRHRFG